MKQKFLKFGSAPKIYSRRMPCASRFGSAAYRSDSGGDDDESDDDDDEGDTKEERMLLRKIKRNIKRSLAGVAKKEDLAATVEEQIKAFKDLPLTALRSIADEKTGVMAVLAAQGEKLAVLEGQAKNSESRVSVRTQVENWQTENKDAIKKIRKGVKTELTELAIDLRVASPMLPSNTFGGSAYIPTPHIEVGYVELARAQPRFWDFLKKLRTSSPVYIWVNKTNPLGAAAFIGPGVAKPGVSFELDTEISNAKKIAAKLKAATELLDDVDGMYSFIKDELWYDVMIKVNETLMTGTASSTVPAGIQTLSVGFTATGIVTTDANNYDAIRACVAQLRSGYLSGAITGFINPIDAANMDLAKAVSSGVYVLPPFSTNDGRSVAGAVIIEDNNVPVGYIQIGFLDLYKIRIYKDFLVSVGWENDDFTKNLVTFIGEMRLHQYFGQNHTGAFIYDSFANIIAAIS